MRVGASPAYYCDTGAVPYLTPEAIDPDREYRHSFEPRSRGPIPSMRKREVIDEFGWRHFGEIYGDHEAFFTPVRPRSSRTTTISTMRSPASRTSSCERRPALVASRCDELAAHVADIDIYHTDRDKAAVQPRPVLAHRFTTSMRTLRRIAHTRRRAAMAAARRASTTTPRGSMLHWFLTGEVDVPRRRARSRGIRHSHG